MPSSWAWAHEPRAGSGSPGAQKPTYFEMNLPFDDSSVLVDNLSID